MWYLYITKNHNGAFYTGVTSNLERRLKEHRQGKGGHYTRNNRPQKLLYTEKFISRRRAEERERQIKRWSKAKKKALVEANLDQLRKLSISRDHLAVAQLCRIRPLPVNTLANKQFITH
jgi:putative endonuclease